MTQVGTEGDVRRPVSRERLDSWKEIAGYLKRSVRTVRRWERQESLPVHRHHHGKQGTIYSFTNEIDIWLKSRSEDRDAPSSAVARRTAEYLKHHRRRPAVIAVLPFRSLNNDAGEQRFADGLTEEIIQEIGHRYPTQLRVIAFTSVIPYKQSPKQVGSIGRELGADYILEGGLRRYGRRVRLTARLIAAGDQTNIWAESYEIRLPPIFAFQQSLAHQLASSLSDVIHATQKKRRPVAEPTAAAHAAYIEGKSHFGLDEGATKKSIEQLNLAIQRDPNFAASYAELALAYFRRLHLSYPPIAILNQIHEGASKALHLDPTLSCGHTMMAAYNLFGARNWQEADAGLRRAIRLNPSDVWAHTTCAAYHVIAGESRKTIEELQQVHRLDPKSVEHSMWSAILAYFARQFGFAIDRCQEILRMDDTIALAHQIASLCYIQIGERGLALTHCELGRSASSYQVPGAAAACSVYALADDLDSAGRLFEELMSAAESDYVRYAFLAAPAVCMRKNEDALDWLEKAYEQHDPLLVFLKAEPRLEPLSELPRFRDLARRIHLPSDAARAPSERVNRGGAAGVAD